VPNPAPGIRAETGKLADDVGVNEIIHVLLPQASRQRRWGGRLAWDFELVVFLSQNLTQFCKLVGKGALPGTFPPLFECLEILRIDHGGDQMVPVVNELRFFSGLSDDFRKALFSLCNVPDMMAS